MSPEERYWRVEAARDRLESLHYLDGAERDPAGYRYFQRSAADRDFRADLIALEDLTLAEVESLRRLCRREG